MADAGTLTRADLAEILNRQVGLSRADSAAMIESILDHEREMRNLPKAESEHESEPETELLDIPEVDEEAL